MRELIVQRMLTWNVVERLAGHAASIPEAGPLLEQIAAIRDQRLLLELSDPANSVRLALAGLLRDGLQRSRTTNESAFNAAMASLASNGVWLRLSSVIRRPLRLLSA